MIKCINNKLTIEECLNNQTNLPNLPIEILQNILTYVGDWRFCNEKNMIIPQIGYNDKRYAVLVDFLYFREEICFFHGWSSRSGGSFRFAYRFGYNIPIKNTLHLPTYDECREIYSDCYDCSPFRFNKDCMRYLQIQTTIYDSDTPKSDYTILSRVTKYNKCYDSSDSDFDEDEFRSFEKIEYV
jgi:hypothetical protein